MSAEEITTLISEAIVSKCDAARMLAGLLNLLVQADLNEAIDQRLVPDEVYTKITEAEGDLHTLATRWNYVMK